MIWSQVGDLLSPRQRHNAIYDGSKLIIIGGDNTESSLNPSHESLPTENCNIIDGQVLCSEQNPILAQYDLYPELFLVPDNFCKSFP